MSIIDSIILGIVEGLTEYLPVSSTGHLILTQRMLGIGQGEVADAFAICIQAGAIVAVLGLYYRRVLSMFQGLRGRDPGGLRMALCILSAFFPAAILGKLSEEWIDAHLMRLWPVTAAWLIGGVAILAVEWFRPSRKSAGGGLGLESLTPKAALIIGLIQCLAMWPGTSRSLVTIVGGLLVGLNLAAAVEFSFLLGLLTLTAATAYKGLKHGSEMVHDYGLLTIFAGFLAAWISAVVAVKWMVGFLQRRGFAVFGYYRIALAWVVGALLILGKLQDDIPSDSAPKPVPAPTAADALAEPVRLAS